MKGFRVEPLHSKLKTSNTHLVFLNLNDAWVYVGPGWFNEPCNIYEIEGDLVEEHVEDVYLTEIASAKVKVATITNVRNIRYIDTVA